MHKPTAVDEELDVLRRRVAELEHALATTRQRLHWKLQLAAQVHRSLMPHPFRDPRIWVDVRYVPIEEVGGDYCQVRFPDRDTCYVTICDVTGHGIGASLLATRVSSEVRYGILYGRDPRDIVRALNAFICDHFDATDLYLTFFAARIDLTRRQLTYSGAGHPAPLLLRRDGTTIEQLVSQNLVIGVMKNLLVEFTGRFALEWLSADEQLIKNRS